MFIFISSKNEISFTNVKFITFVQVLGKGMVKYQPDQNKTEKFKHYSFTRS